MQRRVPEEGVSGSHNTWTGSDEWAYIEFL